MICSGVMVKASRCSPQDYRVGKSNPIGGTYQRHVNKSSVSLPFKIHKSCTASPALFLVAGRGFRTVHSPITKAVTGTTTANADTEAFPALGKASTIPLREQVISDSALDLIPPLDQMTLYHFWSARNEECSKRGRKRTRAQGGMFSSRLQTNSREGEMSFGINYTITETEAAGPFFNSEHESAIQGCKDVAGLIQHAPTASTSVIDAVGGSSAVINKPFGTVLGTSLWNAPNILELCACL